MMTHIGAFSTPDLLAVLVVLLLWAGSGWIIEHPPASRPSVSLIMQDYRHDWMRQFVTRQPRIFDATLIDSLRQGTAFFASACMIAIGGGVAVIGNSDQLRGIAQDLTIDPNTVQVEVKMILALAFLANALLKFVWAHRLFAYCAVLMAAVPNDINDPQAYPRAAQAADINITAARNFNKGLRAIYFALAALGWLFGPWALILASLAATTVLMRREFVSQSRDVMLRR
ncbi:DUF599 domain-containing protein [Tabrizicola sp. TH137]|uniref:DUF599 domain-containing protein n=1 Tax=Tabrizicola sp. TH137 TaxID=2067452 RepID=UPI000C7AB92C|nr:DUF599 domain-containing protein [Tabrizicola sp. TH137]PLL12185.1 DUF599 domain-containing protein [Tabrizicola sp. TH137]